MLKRLASSLQFALDHPPGYLIRRRMLKWRGSFREKEQNELVARANYAYGMLRAADLARFSGKKKVTVCEFGVATGNGLLNMIELAGPVTESTGVEFRIVGLDTGEGLPVIEGYKDHPELWSIGDFSMTNKEQLTSRIGGRAELIFGDIKDTVDGFTGSLSADAPLGFVAVDVDIYSGSKSALRCLLGPREVYCPAVSMYFDDVRFFFANRWCGELLSIDEFNRDNTSRKIDADRSLPGHRPVWDSPWYKAMYVCHVLDHELREKPRDRGKLSLEEHLEFMKSFSMF